MKNTIKNIITVALLMLLLMPGGVLAQGDETLVPNQPKETNDLKPDPPKSQDELKADTPKAEATKENPASNSPGAEGGEGDKKKNHLDYVSEENIGKITNKYAEYDCDSEGLNSLFGQWALCLTPEQKANNIYTILETPLDTPDSVSQNADDTLIKSCARFTQILNCGKGKVSDQFLVEECPPESSIPGGLYGAVRGPVGKYTGDYYDCQPVTVILSPLEQGGVGFLNAYVGLIYRWAAGVIGIICILIIIISGLQIITGQGEPSVMEEGKKRIFQAIGGIALLFLASALLYIINPTFFNAPKYSTNPKTTPKEMTIPPPTKGEIPIGAPKQVQIDATPPMP